MGATFQNSTNSTSATFDSPSVAVGEVGFLVQMEADETTLGDPTWDGVTMSLAIKLAGGGGQQGSVGIWYILAPTIGVTTIARGTNVDRCVSLTVSVVAQGSPLGDTSSVNGNLGGANMSLSSVLTPDFGISGGSLDAQIGNAAPSGDQTSLYDVEASGRSWLVAYTQAGVGIPTVDHSFDWTGIQDCTFVAANFGGRQVKSHSIIKLMG